MADYYTHFSFVVELEDEAQVDWLIKKLSEAPCEDDEDMVYALCETEKQRGNHVWIHDDGGLGELDDIIDVLCEMQQKFSSHEAISFAWSHDCSRPRDDAYGGGAAVIYGGEYQMMSTSGWIIHKLQGLGKGA